MLLMIFDPLAMLRAFKGTSRLRVFHSGVLFQTMSLSSNTREARTLPISVKDAPSKCGTVYPKELAASVSGREKAKLGDLFGLSNFGVNYTTLQPGSSSALMHYHQTQDEFVYVLQGQATLYRCYYLTDLTDRQEQRQEKTELNEGDCIGFPAGLEVAHCIRNESKDLVQILEIGDRSPNDRVTYPNDDIKAEMDKDGHWIFTRKDGSQFDS